MCVFVIWKFYTLIYIYIYIYICVCICPCDLFYRFLEDAHNVANCLPELRSPFVEKYRVRPRTLPLMDEDIEDVLEQYRVPFEERHDEEIDLHED